MSINECMNFSEFSSFSLSNGNDKENSIKLPGSDLNTLEMPKTIFILFTLNLDF